MLLGYRELLRTPRGVVPELGPGAEPWVVVESSGDIRGAELVISGGGQRRRASLVAERTSPRHLALRVTEPLGEMAAGPGTVALLVEGRTVRGWTVQWGLPRADGRARRCAAGQASERGSPPSPGTRHATPYERVQVYAQAARDAAARHDPTEEVVERWLAMAAEAERYGLLSERSRGLQSAAMTAIFGRQLERASALLDRAVELDRSIGNEPKRVEAALYRGQLLHRLGRNREAAAVFAEGIERSRRLGLHRQGAYLAISYAVSLSEAKRHREALATIGEAEPLMDAARATANNNLLSTYYSTRGHIELRAALDQVVVTDHETPRQSFLRALTLARECLRPVYTLSILESLATLARIEGRDDRLERRLAQYREIDPGGTAFTEGLVLTHEGFLALHRAQLDRAEQSFRRAQRVWDEDYPPPAYERWESSLGLGLVALRRDHAAEAHAWLDRAVDQVLRVAGQQPLHASGGRSLSDPRSVFTAIIEAALDDGDVERAFLMAELRETYTLRTLDAASRVARLTPQQRADWERRLQAYERTRLGFERQRGLVGEVPLGELARERRRLDELRRRAARDFAAAYEVLERASPSLERVTSIDPIVAELGRSAAIVFPVEVNGRPLTFRLVQGELTVDETPEPRDAWSWLPSAPDGLEHVYVLALRASQGSGSPALFPADEDVLSRVSVSELPYLDLLTRPRPAERAEDALVIADPAGDLVHARREGRSVAGRLAPHVDLLVGHEATRERVVPLLDDRSLLHVSGHGLMTASEPWDAHLQLADDGRLGLEELLVLRPRVGRVVLSGCRTGTVGTTGAAAGLAEAFLLAGARSVVASLGDADDEEAARFMDRFYDAGGAEHPAEAFRLAALAELADGEHGHQLFRILGLP
ncbi:MAG: CHAT domain-containing protein [Sandaracinaceae bacterium]